MNEIMNILGLVGIATLSGQAIAWAFDPIQRIKRYVVLDSDGVAEKYCSLTIERSQPLPERIHKLASKAINCDSCCSFWSCLAIGLPILGLTALIAAPLAFTLSAMIGRLLPMD